jgi:hypothetical protein
MAEAQLREPAVPRVDERIRGHVVCARDRHLPDPSGHTSEEADGRVRDRRCMMSERSSSRVLVFSHRYTNHDRVGFLGRGMGQLYRLHGRRPHLY